MPVTSCELISHAVYQRMENLLAMPGRAVWLSAVMPMDPGGSTIARKRAPTVEWCFGLEGASRFEHSNLSHGSDSRRRAPRRSPLAGEARVAILIDRGGRTTDRPQAGSYSRVVF